MIMEEICMGTLIIKIDWNFNVLFSFAATLKTNFFTVFMSCQSISAESTYNNLNLK